MQISSSGVLDGREVDQSSDTNSSEELETTTSSNRSLSGRLASTVPYYFVRPFYCDEELIRLRTYGNTITFVLARNRVNASIDLVFNFTAVPPPEVEVLFITPTTGYVQSPDWDGSTNYPRYMNKWARLDVPSNASVMISFLAMDIEGHAYCGYDRLTLVVQDVIQNDDSPKKLEEIVMHPLEWRKEDDEYVTCPSGHVTQTFMACDVKSVCWANQIDASTEACDYHVTPPPPSMECMNGVDHVPYTLVCDHRPDCSDNSDENFCVFPSCRVLGKFQCSNKQCVAHDLRCDDILHCLDGSDERQCPLWYSKIDVNTPNPPALVEFDGYGSYMVKPVEIHSNQTNSICPETHFLCPGNLTYCMPVFVRCNGVYDCPGREDEEGCDRYQCPGFYRCRASQICIHANHTCDGVFHCPQRDDELLCDATCPQNCTCQGLAFYCQGHFPAGKYRELRFLHAPGSGLTLESFAINYLLVYLNLAKCNLKNISNIVFPNLRILDLSDNEITSLSTTQMNNMNNLQKLSLSGNPINFPFAIGHFYRIILSVFAALALIGNLGSFVYRVLINRVSSNLGFGVFVTHLCISDFLMGLYLAVIGVADRIYQGNYLWNDEIWKRSAGCKLAGFLSLLSSEVSAFIICLITFDRFLVLHFPFSNMHFKKKSAHVACMIVWLIGIMLAGIPLLPVTAHWNFYSQNGICIPLPITRNDFPGHDYSFIVIIVVNFILFLLIAAGQVFIFWSIRTNSMAAGDSNKKSNDLAIARRLITIAMSDFLCWFPIGLLGLLASSGVPIDGEVNVAIAIIILPVNSAINPFLYTINMLLERRRKAQEKRIQKMIMSTFASKYSETVVDRLDDGYTKSEALNMIRNWLSQNLLSSENLKKVILDAEEKQKALESQAT
ncbi:uncharacterized protein LOC143296633 [Babylonia areolata]|uniref:uncharacterized protein LOC143296633 n=1 Tax=Babylonia areolata TaxID=304850 RepID=UPI003FCF62AA